MSGRTNEQKSSSAMGLVGIFLLCLPPSVWRSYCTTKTPHQNSIGQNVPFLRGSPRAVIFMYSRGSAMLRLRHEIQREDPQGRRNGGNAYDGGREPFRHLRPGGAGRRDRVRHRGSQGTRRRRAREHLVRQRRQRRRAHHVHEEPGRDARRASRSRARSRSSSGSRPTDS